MKNDTEQQQLVQLAIARAERMVNSEGRLSRLKVLGAPEAVITCEREAIGQNMERILFDRLAEQLLPQARIISSMREDRLQYLSKNTFLGFCSNRLQDLFIEVSHQDGEIEGYETGEEELDVLEKAIRSGDRLNIVGTIANILIHIQRDLALRDEELPPLPPRYTVPI